MGLLLEQIVRELRLDGVLVSNRRRRGPRPRPRRGHGRSGRRQHPQRLVGERRGRGAEQRLEIGSGSCELDRTSVLSGSAGGLCRAADPDESFALLATVPERDGSLEAPNDVLDVVGPRLWKQRELEGHAGFSNTYHTEAWTPNSVQWDERRFAKTGARPPLRQAARTMGNHSVP